MQHNYPPIPLLGPLVDLNARTLQSVLTSITKDLGVDWKGDVPSWWPQEIPFRKPFQLVTELGLWHSVRDPINPQISSHYFAA